MFVEKSRIVEIAQIEQEQGENPKKIVEMVLRLAIEDIKSTPDEIDEGLWMVEDAYRNREERRFGESERLSPLRAAALYTLGSRVSPFREASEEIEGNMSVTLSDLSSGMAFVLQSLIAAEAVVHSGADKYVEENLNQLGIDNSSEQKNSIVKFYQTWAQDLIRCSDAVRFAQNRLVEMHVYMGGFDINTGKSVEPKTIFTPAQVRGGRFAVDAYRLVYPRAQEVFHPTGK